MTELTRHQIYYQKNRARLIQQAKLYRQQDYARFTQSRLKYHSSIHGRSLRMWSSAKKRCELNGLEFSLSLDWVREKVISGHCEVTGIPFQLSGNSTDYRNPYGPSLDRKKSREGYTPDNCRVILWGLNMALSDWGEGVYEEIARAYLATKLEYDL